MKNATKTKQLVKEINEEIKELEVELKSENSKENHGGMDDLVKEFLELKKPTKEIIREFINRIEIHENKQVDVYFNFKSLQNLNNKFICAKKDYEKNKASA
ncbi:MAG: DUF4368 domain-containing protein [Clostridia bacterium]|nr:DUF4368 domain-containing protein [Clostridia bacterium]